MGRIFFVSVLSNAMADLCLTIEVSGRDEDWNEIDKLYLELRPIMERVTNHINGL